MNISDIPERRELTLRLYGKAERRLAAGQTAIFEGAKMNKVNSEKSQEQLVLEYLKEHKTITSKQAFEHLGIIQAPKRIFNLKKMGYNIVTTPCSGKNRFGKVVHFVKWALA